VDRRISAVNVLCLADAGDVAREVERDGIRTEDRMAGGPPRRAMCRGGTGPCVRVLENADGDGWPECLVSEAWASANATWPDDEQALVATSRSRNM
jgi:hypothetical protein